MGQPAIETKMRDGYRYFGEVLSAEGAAIQDMLWSGYFADTPRDDFRVMNLVLETAMSSRALSASAVDCFAEVSIESRQQFQSFLGELLSVVPSVWLDNFKVLVEFEG